MLKKKRRCAPKNHPCQVTLRAGSPQEWRPRDSPKPSMHNKKLTLCPFPPNTACTQERAQAFTTIKIPQRQPGNIGDWDVSAVKDFTRAFAAYRDKKGRNGNLNLIVNTITSDLFAPISKWDTSSVTSLASTFQLCKFMDIDLTGWDTSEAISLESTFYGASAFTGTGLGSWDTAAVATLDSTFRDAGEMNTDLSKWSVAKVYTMKNAFSGAIMFRGVGLEKWNVANVGGNRMTNVFRKSASVEFNSCTQRKIADAWKISGAFVNFASSSNNVWHTNKCTGYPLTDVQFKQASFGTCSSEVACM